LEDESVSVRRQENLVIRARIKGITLLLLLVGEVFLLIGIVTPVEAALSPLYWTGLAVVLLGVGFILWRPVVIKPVERIKGEIATSETSDHTLVRASDLPPSQQRAELLRAGGTRTETPPAQLLRAGNESRQDV
jgi:hypothetical protein